jgi:hypothetical protein
VAAATVPETMSTVSATNGTVTITLAAAPTTAPVAGDFTATSTINSGTPAALTLGGFSYDGNVTVTYTFTPIAQTASAQSIVVTVAGGTGSPIAASAFDVSATTTTGLTFNPPGGNITASTPITITPSSSLSTTEAVYWNTTGPLPNATDYWYQNAAFNLSASGTVYAAVYDSQTGSWGDQASATYTVGPATVPETMSTVAATNGTVTITLAAAPTTAPVAGDFTATSTINSGTPTALTLGNFSYNSSTATVTYTFTPIAQSASVFLPA